MPENLLPSSITPVNTASPFASVQSASLLWEVAGEVGVAVAVAVVHRAPGRRAFADLERWQPNYLPVYAAWAVVVVTAFPPLFRCV